MQPQSFARTSTQAPFHGLWVPLVTPFKQGAVDHAALARLTQHLSTQGVSGFVACGSTGEAAALSHDEQLAVLDTVLAATPLPVVMGVSGYHLPHLLAWVSLLATRPAARPLAGLLVPPPHYIRPSQAGVLHWFDAIAQASALPLIVYDIPYRTGCPITRDTLLQISELNSVLALKDCGGDAIKTQAVLSHGKLQVLCGEDPQIFGTLALGGSGAIAACGHVHTAELVEIMTLIQAGQLEAARPRWWHLLPLIEALLAEPNPAPVKALLAQQGWLCNELRPPMMQATEAFAEKLVRLSKTCQGLVR